jgi:hypothetical protein
MPNAEGSWAAKAQVKGHLWQAPAINGLPRLLISGFGVRVPGGAQQPRSRECPGLLHLPSPPFTHPFPLGRRRLVRSAVLPPRGVVGQESRRQEGKDAPPRRRSRLSPAPRAGLDRVLDLAPDCDREPLDRVQVARPVWRHAAAADLADREQTGRQSVKWSSLPVSMAIARADRVKESMI